MQSLSLAAKRLDQRPDSTPMQMDEMSLLFSNAHWITSPIPQPGSGPLPLFRKSFCLQQPLVAATLHICGLGQFEALINGISVSQDVLTPGWTQYRKTCLYLSYDVTDLLRQSENVLGVILGNGMYHVPGGRYAKFTSSFGPPKLIAVLELKTDTQVQHVVSDTSWRVAAGPTTFSCIYGGEDYDARLDVPGWSSPGFDDKKWIPAIVCSEPGGKLIEQKYPPIRVMHTFDALAWTTPASGVRVYDTAQNSSGWPTLSVIAGNANASVKLITGEQLDASGRVVQSNTGTPVEFNYTSNGVAARWSPRFTLTGFRYIEVSGDLDLIDRIGGASVHSSAKTVGDFECSNTLLNRTHQLILAAVRSNTHSVFTDCPHREKLGWLEVPHLMGPSILYNLDVGTLFQKMLQDIRDAQHSNGMVPTIAPQFTVFEGESGSLFNDSPEWGAACVLAPWFVFRHTGDVSIVRDNYDVMRRYMNYLAMRCDRDGIIRYGLGDWYDIGPGAPGFGKNTSLGVTATSVYAQCLNVMVRFAQLMKHPTDAASYAQRFDSTRRAFNACFFDRDVGVYDRGSQCAQAMPLVVGLVESSARAGVLDALVNDIRAHDNHVTAGDIGYRYVLAALAEAGRSDVIFDMLSRNDPPSYGAQLAAGATTLTEAWDADPASSLNHMMLGHAEEWFYRYLAGIKVDLTADCDAPQIVIDPQIVGDVTWCRAYHDVPQGRIATAWQRNNDVALLRIQTPAGLRAAVRVQGTLRPLSPGECEVQLPLTTVSILQKDGPISPLICV